MPNKAFYKSKKWQKVRELVILRDRDICFFCGQLILKRRTIHHKEELNENNINDATEQATASKTRHMQFHGIEINGTRQSMDQRQKAIDEQKIIMKDIMIYLRPE